MDNTFVSYLIRLKAYSTLRNMGIIKSRPLFDNKSKKDFCGRSVISASEGNNLICELMRSSQPVMIARIGTIEMGTLNACMMYEQGIRRGISNTTKQSIRNNAGFFGKGASLNDYELTAFFDIYKKAMSKVDLLASFENHEEDFFVNQYASNEIVLAQLCSLEPYYFVNPWTRVLENKRVLVIHPFAETIERQYTYREKLFGENKILPLFELETIQAVQTIGEDKAGFEDWFEALSYMKNQIQNKDFDIAIIGCGAYGFPLAAYVKEIGKKSIVMAGATQLLFGIKGKRWDNNPMINKWYNEFWVRPTMSERPKAANSVENGCYW